MGCEGVCCASADEVRGGRFAGSGGFEARCGGRWCEGGEAGEDGRYGTSVQSASSHIRAFRRRSTPPWPRCWCRRESRPRSRRSIGPGRFAKPLACTSISKSDATRRAFDSARNMACSFTARSRSIVSRSEAGVVQGRCGGSEFRQLLRRDGDSETAQRSERSYQCRFPSSSSGPKIASTASRRRSALRRLIENSASFFRASQRFDRFSVRMLCLEFEGDHDAPVEK